MKLEILAPGNWPYKISLSTWTERIRLEVEYRQAIRLVNQKGSNSHNYADIVCEFLNSTLYPGKVFLYISTHSDHLYDNEDSLLSNKYFIDASPFPKIIRHIDRFRKMHNIYDS